jgi:hypothetical protein
MIDALYGDYMDGLGAIILDESTDLTFTRLIR